jgi:hypothetical protein
MQIRGRTKAWPSDIRITIEPVATEPADLDSTE